jgi:CysZ protein
MKRGLSAFFAGLTFIRKNKLLHYFIYPILITLLLWLGGIKVMTETVDWLKEITSTYLQLPVYETDPDAGFWTNSWETAKSWMNSGSVAIVSLIVGLVFMILMFLTTKYVMLALLSPALALISERSEEILTGNKYPFSLTRFLKDVGRGILISMRNMFMETTLLALLWIMSMFVPIVLPLTAVLSVFITSYYYGYSMIDYVHERKQIPMREGSMRIRDMKGIAIALGVCIALSVQVPVIGFILAGCASLMAAVAAVTLDQQASEKMYIEHE